MLLNTPLHVRRLKDIRAHRSTKKRNSGQIQQVDATIERVVLEDGRVLPLTKHQIKSRRSNPQAAVKLSKKQQRKMKKRVQLADALKQHQPSSVMMQLD